MYICFVNNAETQALKEGLIQGGSDNKKNQATPEGLKKVKESAEEIIKAIKEAKIKNVYLYTGDQDVCLQTSKVLVGAFQEKGMLPDENLFLCPYLNGRNFGSIEGLEESKLKDIKYAIKNPKQVMSYALANAGFENPEKVETSDAYASGVFRFLHGVFKEYEAFDYDSMVIVSSTPDFYKSMQTHKDIRHLCYSGKNPKQHSIPKDDVIGPGEFRFVEVNMLKALPKHQSWIYDEDFMRYETHKIPERLLHLVKPNEQGYAKGEE